MHPKFAALAEGLQPKLEQLLACAPHTGKVRLVRDVPRSAVYLFSEGEDHLYVGRTDRLRDRHREHWAGRDNDAPFAFKLAREATGAALPTKLTRKALAIHPAFAEAFRSARDRVAAMQFRWVEETDPNRQCLLELYATVALDARYNDFMNH